MNRLFPQRLFTLCLVWVSAALLAACELDDDDDPVPVAPGTIAEVAGQQGFTALLAAASKAGLASALSDPNANLTVFAPTDAAFTQMATRLGFASATAMVNALPASALANVLSYHVLPSKKTSTDLAAGGATQATLYAFEGSPATLAINTTGGVALTDAVLTASRVTTADVAARNGVIHAVDKVLVPPGVLTIVQMAQLNPAFDSLVNAVVAANLQGTLSGAGPFTVFAPVNDAFTAIASTVVSLTPTQLSTVLTYHVLGSQVLSSGIPFGTPVQTVAGQNITINSGSPPVIVDTTTAAAAIVATDVRASNGAIHVIDKVLIPAL